MKGTSDRRKPEKLVLLLLAVVAIGMFALPSTLAMYSGQHEFVGADEVDCNKCHGSTDAIYGELSAGTAHELFTCKQCHGFSNATLTTPNANGTEGHAATVAISCVDCHAESALYLTIGLDPDALTVVQEFGATDAAHAAMYTTYSSGDLDDLCIGCHTTVAMSSNVTYSPGESYLPLNTWNYS